MEIVLNCRDDRGRSVGTGVTVLHVGNHDNLRIFLRRKCDHPSIVFHIQLGSLGGTGLGGDVIDALEVFAGGTSVLSGGNFAHAFPDRLEIGFICDNLIGYNRLFVQHNGAVWGDDLIHDLSVVDRTAVGDGADIACNGDGGDLGDRLSDGQHDGFIGRPVQLLNIGDHGVAQVVVDDVIFGQIQVIEQDFTDRLVPLGLGVVRDGDVQNLFDHLVDALLVIFDISLLADLLDLGANGIGSDDGFVGGLFVDGDVGVVQVALIADETGGFTGKLDVGLGSQAQRCRPLVDVVGTERIADSIEEIVAGIAEAVDDGLILMVFRMRGPAFRRVGGISQIEAALVVDAGVQRNCALGQTGKRGAQLEDRSGRVLRGDGAVVQRVVALADFLPVAVGDAAAVKVGQIKVGIADHAQHAAGVGIHGHQCAGIGQRDLLASFGVFCQHISIAALPAG